MYTDIVKNSDIPELYDGIWQYIDVNNFPPIKPRLEFLHLNCVVCQKSYSDPTFVKSYRGFPSYYIGKKQRLDHALCSPKCGIKFNDRL
jgi:hypothetical protein